MNAEPTHNILFVCLGNICRSPTAHGVFEALLIAEGLDDIVRVDSAGTGDWHVGHPPDDRSIRAALGRGYDLKHIRSRQVCAEDFEQFDHILAMDLSNLAALEKLSPPNFSGKLSLFLDYTDESKPAEVPDPYGGQGDGFEHVLTLIETAAEGLLASLMQGRPS